MTTCGHGSHSDPRGAGRPASADVSQVVTFRLDDDEHAALLTLAKRANLGPSALARRIVEAYIAEHAPESMTPRNRGVRR